MRPSSRLAGRASASEPDGDGVAGAQPPSKLKWRFVPADQRLMDPEDLARRDVSWDPVAGTLTVGGRTTRVDCEPGDNEALLRIYLDLVAEQRAVTLDGGVQLRRDDVIVLSELLDLDDADLEDRLRRLLHLSGKEAADLHKRLRRQRVATAAFSVGMLAAGMPLGAALSDATGQPTQVVTESTSHVSEPVDTPVTVAVPPPTAVPVVASIPDPIPDPIAEQPAAAEPAAEDPAPAPEPEVEIGDTVVYERDPDFVPPPGVDIGDAMVIEREPPVTG